MQASPQARPTAIQMRQDRGEVAPMLQITDLTVRFGTTAAVDRVTLGVPAGQMVGVIGRSGAGKSTLLRAINRLQEPKPRLV